MNKVKVNISNYVVISYITFIIFALIVAVRVINIIKYESEELLKKARAHTLKKMDIEAIRGNIYAQDGSLLATSIPIYEIRMDLNTEALTDDIFYESIDGLARGLSNLFNDKSPSEWKKNLINARKKGNRYYLIKRNISFKEMQEIKKLPILSLGQYKGGLIIIQKSRRAKPFGLLASRLIGYDVENVKSVGLEGAYSTYLKGQNGKMLMRKLAGGIWMPVEDENQIEPINGSDIYTTIDVNLQDVAEHALITQLEKHQADHGCVVVMEVKTGDIKAMANLKRTQSGQYEESFNYAVGEATEPGSTFKTASLMALFEDQLADTSEIVDTYDGTYKFYDRVMRDSHKGGYGKISVKRALEVSSNVAVSKLVFDRYSKNPSKFVNRLFQMGLGRPLGIEIFGEGKPRIKRPEDKDWYGTTLPWMSIGYEVKLTPLQILTFYNAIANNGTMVKPRFVTQISFNGRTIKHFPVEVIKPSICSQATINKIKPILEGVVENGTAKNLKNDYLKIAGKTGTAQVAKAKHGYKNEEGISYQASFVGYFPAENPKYSCIVVVHAPSNDVYYGNLVAGPIFKEIADKVYASDFEIIPSINEKQILAENLKYYFTKSIDYSELKEIASKLNLPIDQIPVDQSYSTDKFSVKDIIGMNMKDAVYLLESKGYAVIPIGIGSVKQIDTVYKYKQPHLILRSQI